MIDGNDPTVRMLVVHIQVGEVVRRMINDERIAVLQTYETTPL